MGDPDEPYGGPTAAQERKQAEAEAIRAAVARMHYHQFTAGDSAGKFFSHTHDDDDLGHLHDDGHRGEAGPSLGTEMPEELVPRAIAMAEKILSGPPRSPSELTTWRLRLYCGHVAERSAHSMFPTVSQAFTFSPTCPTCGLDPATIVAARALPRPPAKTPRARKRTGPEGTAETRRKLAKAQAEVDRLRAQLEGDGEPS